VVSCVGAGCGAASALFILFINSSLETPAAIYSLSSAFLNLVSSLLSTSLIKHLLDDHNGGLLWYGVELSKEPLLLRASLQLKRHRLCLEQGNDLIATTGQRKFAGEMFGGLLTSSSPKKSFSHCLLSASPSAHWSASGMLGLLSTWPILPVTKHTTDFDCCRAVAMPS
jgi:hypothetical protein